jgi:hypothetical protein
MSMAGKRGKLSFSERRESCVKECDECMDGVVPVAKLADKALVN